MYLLFSKEVTSARDVVLETNGKNRLGREKNYTVTILVSIIYYRDQGSMI